MLSIPTTHLSPWLSSLRSVIDDSDSDLDSPPASDLGSDIFDDHSGLLGSTETSFSSLFPDNSQEDVSTQPKTTGSTCLSPHRLRTLKFWRYLEEQGDTSAWIKEVLAYMLSKSIDLPILLRLLSWGAEELINDPFMRFEWTALMGSSELSECLDEWYLPNRSHERGVKTQGTHQTLTHWATSCVGDMVTKEMVKIGKVLHSELEELSEETLLAVKWESLTNTTKQEAPVLWQLLRQCAWTADQDK
ncbi:predicted protein [Postia placenta Mad-698-R]|uniref:Uncharacterized protein n=1 Tax=Postia placenta MAD-698-R-SB12 TaxID=670580 RepID=A0A1X6N5C0_9APHY|nr:hypothetical protein POSPLADRAFT_1055668 [Postia placenta MAD-698-R-SB12]EED84973.1 predicted protein [Postia placenta Mad-698-R]OSX63623.1 hypothetical protein POSPLADRAFT_1055668 [Postia placenta MAD-698-R-SB12]